MTAASLRDIWLHEGFACYAEWLWSESIGRTTAQEEAERHHALLARLPQDLVLTDPGPRHTFDDRVYKRGALTLHTLRRAVGDDLFFALLRSWVDTHRFGVVTTAGFEALVRDETGLDPGRLLGPWLRETSLPPLVARPRRPADVGEDLRPADGLHPGPGHPTTQSVTSTRGPSTQRPRTATVDARPDASSPAATPVNDPVGDSSTRTASCPATTPASGYHAL